MRRTPGVQPLPGSVTAVAETERAISLSVEQHAQEWFPELRRSPTVRLRLLAARPKSRLYAVHLPDRGDEPALLAKCRLTSSIVGRSHRPRLTTDSPSLEDLAAAEFAGLQTIHRAFGSLHDDRFGTVRPLEHLVAERTILMEFVSAPTLRVRLARENRLSPAAWRRTSRSRAWTSAGAWLRRFQDGVPTVQFPPRQATRPQVLAMYDDYADYLGHRLRSRYAADLVRDARALAEQSLPTALPLAVGHGDYAPRNVFVDPDGRVTVFDPLPRWAVPSYEDLCRFTVGMRLLGVQVHTRGAAHSRGQLERRIREVLDGFAVVDASELAALRCYELLIMFDKWSAMLDQGAGGLRGRARMRSLEATSGYLAHEGRRLLERAAREA